MASPSKPRADAAYGRAVAAYQQKSYDAARRSLHEALAEDPEHAGARALLARLDAMAPSARPGSQPPMRPPAPEVVSTDPTVLISRASRPAPSEPIEPTVLIQRDDASRRAGGRAAPPPRRDPITETGGRPVAEPTVILPPKPRGAPPRPKPSSSSAAAAGAVPFWQRLFGRGGAARPATAAGRQPAAGRESVWSPGTRGAVIAVAAVIVGSLLVWGVIRVTRWLWPAGQALTITKPTGGTITGPGVRCGTRGADCSTNRPTGEPIELEAQADSGFVFSGFTGDCAPTGRTSMSQPRTCGATFDPVASAPTSAAAFRLSITKPVGGTIVGAGGILCGTLGSSCAADVPSGAPVTLHFEADSGYTFSQFTGDCPANGEMTMTASKTCSAAFTPTSAPVANVLPSSSPVAPPRPRRAERSEPPPAAPPQKPVPSTPLPSPQTPTVSTTPTPVSPDKPAAPPITAEEHAKREIQDLVKRYCGAYETLKADNVKALFPLVGGTSLRDQFKEYKSLRCTLTAPPEFELLNASETGVGSGQVKFGMKQDIVMKSNGAPKVVETNVTMKVSRTDVRSAWVIDWVKHVEKPKS